MHNSQYCIKLPANEPHQMEQDEAYFLLDEAGETQRFRFHDYGQIYQRPGLYEQLFYDRLKCASPRKVGKILEKVLRRNRFEMSELRVLDIGAGNGMFGEELHRTGVARVVGIDIAKDAKVACERDRPGIYDAYYVADLQNLDPQLLSLLKSWQPDCMSCVAALGFGDVPARAFANAFNLIQTGGWVAFNIKETFLLESDTSGFASLIKALMMSDALELHHLERYRHRISIDGRPLFYYALVGRKEFDIPLGIMPGLD